MRTLSTAAWVAHNLGLAACFGGLLFGKAALNPNLSAIESEAERGKILNTAWNRYNAINVASFATAAITWFPGRLGLSGKEIDQQTRNLVLAKDILFGVGAFTGLASVIQGRALTGPCQSSQARRPPPRRRRRLLVSCGRSTNLAT